MNYSKKFNIPDKTKTLREVSHRTTPPRLEGKIKNAMMNPIRKKRDGCYHK